MDSVDTITAVATPPGRGGVGVIRISGKDARAIAECVCAKTLAPRTAVFTRFYDNTQVIIDEGIAIYFKAPQSFTGEDVVELQGHGSPLVMDQLLRVLVHQGARLARPGEFSERAFLNGKLDLVQAESIADLINASTLVAAQSAMRSLQGAFSQEINRLLDQLIRLRMFVESSIDFTDEDIDFLGEHQLIESLEALKNQIDTVRRSANQGALLQTGIYVVIAGLPNAGKSSLLNCLSGRDAAIVTEIPGTTRDVLKESIHIDGLPIHILDTAGLRDTDCQVEQEGVRRAHREMAQADLILWVYDAEEPSPLPTIFPPHIPVIQVKNKIDLNNAVIEPGVIGISAKYELNIDQLKQAILDQVGFQSAESSTFMARRRHLDALDQTSHFIEVGVKNYKETHAQELLAEDLRCACDALGAITGRFTSDDLLGKIFAEFCIGK